MRPTDPCTIENIRKELYGTDFIAVMFLLERDFTHRYTLNYFTVLCCFLDILMWLSFEMMEGRKQIFLS